MAHEVIFFVGLFTHWPFNPDLLTLKKKTFENIVGKGENAGDQHFLPFLQCFLPIPQWISVFKFHLFHRSQMRPIVIW